MASTFTNGTTVQIRQTTPNVALRYLGRTGTIVGQVKQGRGTRFQVSMGDRRVEPLEIAGRWLTVAA